VTPEKTVVLGFSQGGVVSLDVTLNEGVAAHAGCLSGYLSMPEAPAAPAAPLRVFMAHGTADNLIRVQVARKSKRALEDMKLAVEYHEYDMGHDILPEEVVALRAWLNP
jgi:phospholipase/carboxylesterase